VKFVWRSWRYLQILQGIFFNVNKNTNDDVVNVRCSIPADSGRNLVRILAVPWLKGVDWLWWGETDVSEPLPSLACCSPPGECEWRAVVVKMPHRDNYWLVYQISLAVLPAETYGASRRSWRKNENFAYSLSLIRQRIFTCRKIIRHGTSGCTYHPKEGVLRIFIALKNPSPRSDLNPRPLGPVASTLTTTPPKRLKGFTRRHFDAEAWVRVGFVVDKLALRQAFTPSSSVFSCQYHFTVAPFIICVCSSETIWPPST
jgi:hypothetical protein